MTTTLAHRVGTLTDLIVGVRTAVSAHVGWTDTAQLVAEQLRELPARPGRADARTAASAHPTTTSPTPCTSSRTVRSRSSP
jgi:hypothetical protein